MEESTGQVFAGERAEVRVVDSGTIYLLDVYNYYFPSPDKIIAKDLAGWRVILATIKFV